MAILEQPAIVLAHQVGGVLRLSECDVADVTMHFATIDWRLLLERPLELMAVHGFVFVADFF